VTLSDTALDVPRQVAAIRAALAARADPAYEAGMRRTVPSDQPAHATRIPDVRRVATDWTRGHKGLPTVEVFAVCDALQDTGWREERIVAMHLLGHSRATIAALDWGLVERWSHRFENWEHVDNFADVTGKLLQARPELILDVWRLSVSDSPWQRRLALVTLILAARGGPWRVDLASMAQQLSADKHPLVRKAVVWARRELGKLGGAVD
jgi:3-methyladenine DNA glycosylase AlkD